MSHRIDIRARTCCWFVGKQTCFSWQSGWILSLLLMLAAMSKSSWTWKKNTSAWSWTLSHQLPTLTHTNPRSALALSAAAISAYNHSHVEMVHPIAWRSTCPTFKFSFFPSLPSTPITCLLLSLYPCTTGYITQITTYPTPQHYSHQAPLRWADFLLSFHYIYLPSILVLCLQVVTNI